MAGGERKRVRDTERMGGEWAGEEHRATYSHGRVATLNKLKNLHCGVVEVNAMLSVGVYPLCASFSAAGKPARAAYAGVCMCVCARARACVCACVYCARAHTHTHTHMYVCMNI